MDTLDQDRTFSESEKSFAQEISELIRDSNEVLENKIRERKNLFFNNGKIYSRRIDSR